MVQLLIIYEDEEFQVQWVEATSTLNEAKTYHTSDYEDALATMLTMAGRNGFYTKVFNKFVHNYLNNNINNLDHRDVFKAFVIRFLKSHIEEHEASLFGISPTDVKTFLEYIETI